ncbi:MAG: isoprenylcysteine carboxylmethyltransferase family protein [Bauldia sp.]
MSEIRLDPMASETGITAAPPFVFMAGILTAVLLGWLYPLGFGLPTAVRFGIAIALVLPLPLIMPFVVASFKRIRSDYDVQKMPLSLATDGPFRFSRNPGYVAFFLFFLGIAFFLDNVYALILVLVGVVFVHFKVVLKEEALLENRFGRDYLDYKSRVRRWI